MSRIEKVLAAIAVIDFAGAVLAGFLGQEQASLFMIAALPLGWLIWITREVVLLREHVSTSKSQASLPPDLPELKASLKPKPRPYLTDHPIWISPARKNSSKIRSDFLEWDQCTLMMWVLVPKKGHSLRSAPHERYLLAHQTSAYEGYNQFALRHSPNNRWELLFSNGRAERGQLSVEDGLDDGWHHFLIAWDRRSPNLTLLIDRRSGGSDCSRSYAHCWPEHLNENVTVGASVFAGETSYCETSLFALWIVDRFLEPTDPMVREHFELNPSKRH